MNAAPTKYHTAELAWAEAFGRASGIAEKIRRDNAQAVKVSEAWAMDRPAFAKPAATVVNLGAHVARNRKGAQLARRREEHAALKVGVATGTRNAFGTATGAVSNSQEVNTQ